MELRPYYDRPTAVISDYLARIDQRCVLTTPIGAMRTRVFQAKGEYGKGILRADQFPAWNLRTMAIPRPAPTATPTILLTPTAGLSAP